MTCIECRTGLEVFSWMGSCSIVVDVPGTLPPLVIMTACPVPPWTYPAAPASVV